MLVSIIIVTPLLIYRFFPQLIEMLRNIDELDAFLERNKVTGAFIYIGFQILQVVISVIPGEAVQIAGGYLYGVLAGSILSFIGIGIGSFISFYIARFLGHSAVEGIFGKKQVDKFMNFFSKPKAKILLFLLFLLPGMPKDLLVYVAGISDLRMRSFMMISMTARIPAIVASMLMGSMLRSRSYLPLILVSAATVILFLLGILFRKQIFTYIERALHSDETAKMEENKNAE